MKVTTLDEKSIHDIGHAFGYYDYGEETGMSAAFSGKEATANYICAYVRGVLRGGFLHTTGERGEGYIAYKAAEAETGRQDAVAHCKGDAAQFQPEEARALRYGHQARRCATARSHGQGEEAAYLCRACLCAGAVSGQGYMRKVMDIAFAEGNRLGVPVILETDAKSKCDKYVHLGMELAGVRDIGEFGKLYDLIKKPDAEKQQSVSTEASTSK